LDLLKIKGLGPKKISTVWKELGIESMGELLYACEENRLSLYKGFGEKTQKNIQEAIGFYMTSQGSYLYSQIEQYAAAFTERIKTIFPENEFLITGDFNRHAEVIHKLEWITDADTDKLESFFKGGEYHVEAVENIVSAKGPENVSMEFHSVAKNELYNHLFKRNCSPEFFSSWQEKYGWNENEVMR
jgi:DNA polymerase (family 10)